MTEPAKIPAQWSKHHSSLAKALAVPDLAEWPEETKYIEAAQAEAIGDLLVRIEHDELVNARIAYLFRKEMASRNVVKLAKATRASGALSYLGEVDFVVVINWTEWRKLSATQKLALIDHELCHCQRDFDTGRYQTRVHDVEEFSEIVRRWGLWRPALRTFGSEIMQLDVFTDQPADEEAEPVPAVFPPVVAAR